VSGGARYVLRVMIFRNACIFFLALAGLAEAQLAASLKLSKKNYLAGEPVTAVVTITNHAGKELVFFSDGRTQWLNLILKDSHGDDIMQRGNGSFGKVVIRAGESLSRQVDLSQHFQLSEPGNFSAAAVVHMPGNSGDSASTNRVLFSQSPGLLYWAQKVGIPSRPGESREFRILSFGGENKTQIYAQIMDCRTGQMIRTFLLGDVLMLRKPIVTVDRAQRLHIMFLATPSMWVHCQIDTDGKLADRQLHQRGPEGDPQLMTFGDGTVSVTNSIPYDPKAAAEAKAKIRKASDRPSMTY